MQSTYQRLRLMCLDPTFSQHKINRRHVLPLDEAIWLYFLREDSSPGGAVSLHIELTRHGTPTRDGLIYWWPVIEQWRAKLMEWQGPWTGGGMGYLEARMLAMRQNKDSYATIADWLNTLLREDTATGRAAPLRTYFKLDESKTITPAHVRERLRYLLKTSR